MNQPVGAIVAALVCVAFAAPSPAAGEDPLAFGGWLGASIGGRYFNVADVNRYTSPAGVHAPPTIWPTLGVAAGGVIFERLFIGIGVGASQNQEKGGDVDMTLLSRYGELDVGWAAVNGAGGLAYPFVGLGGAQTDLRFKGAVRELGFDATSDKATISRAVAYATIGFTYYYPVRFAANADGDFGMFLPGVTIGATLETEGKGWAEGSSMLRGGPTLSYNSIFLRIEIALGGGTTGKSAAPPPASRP